MTSWVTVSFSRRTLLHAFSYLISHCQCLRGIRAIIYLKQITYICLVNSFSLICRWLLIASAVCTVLIHLSACSVLTALMEYQRESFDTKWIGSGRKTPGHWCPICVRGPLEVDCLVSKILLNHILIIIHPGLGRWLVCFPFTNQFQISWSWSLSIN
jgi:hypothetical protein